MITGLFQILISELRKLIEEKTQVPANKQRLIYKAKLLKDELRLSDYGKQNNIKVNSKYSQRRFRDYSYGKEIR